MPYIMYTFNNAKRIPKRKATIIHFQPIIDECDNVRRCKLPLNNRIKLTEIKEFKKFKILFTERKQFDLTN